MVLDKLIDIVVPNQRPCLGCFRELNVLEGDACITVLVMIPPATALSVCILPGTSNPLPLYWKEAC